MIDAPSGSYHLLKQGEDKFYGRTASTLARNLSSGPARVEGADRGGRSAGTRADQFAKREGHHLERGRSEKRT